MKITFFSSKPYDQRSFLAHPLAQQHECVFFEARLELPTVKLAEGSGAVCIFVNDSLQADTLEQLAQLGIRLVLLRCAGFNQVDLQAATALGIQVMRVPAYSPFAVAEHTVALLLALNRKIHRAYNRVREGNFALEGLLGFDLYQKTVGIVGTGRIGQVLADILLGFGCQVLGLDPIQNPEFRGRYASESELLRQSHIISLHCPLNPSTHYWVNPERLAQMRPGVILLNTGRGALVDTTAVISALKSGHIGALGLDVYEQESELFFEDLSNEIIQDDVFQRLLTFPNVLVTAHQAFFTQEALSNIADTTWNNLAAFQAGQRLESTTLT